MSQPTAINEFLYIYRQLLDQDKKSLSVSLHGGNGTIKSWEKFLEVQNEYKGLCRAEVLIKEAEAKFVRKDDLTTYREKTTR